MKHLSLLTFSLCLLTFSLSAVPIRWTVETSRVQPAQIEAYHGETIELAATMQNYGKPLAITNDLIGIYWQTNGMGSAYWTAPATLSNNVMTARWTPLMDVGANNYQCFIGTPGEIYRAAFQLRLRPSPGAVPSELPLPVKALDFAQVQVLNPPYYTQEEVESRISSATNAIRRVDGAVRPLPPYLHALDFDDAYPEDAAWYYAQPQDYGHCSSVRDGNSFARNYDWKFDRAAEFVVRMSAGPGRFASVGVANCGTNLTEEIATGGKWSRYFKCLPGRTIDGINENGVVANVNVVSGVPSWQTGDGLHPLAAVRWVLDNAVSAASAAQHLAEHIRFPAGWTQNFHWMIADATETWIVENGAAHKVTGRAAMTNFPLYPTRGSGEGQERYDALMGGSNITSQWWTLTYTPGGYRASDLPGIDSNLVFAAWASKPRESHRGETFGDVAWWQTVHTSVYDITNRTLRIAVQERDDWYVFSVPQGGKVKSVNGQTGDVVLAGEDVISDLATIRSGAALGTTAVQPSAIADMETQTHAAATYQPKGSYLTTESDPSVDDKIWTHNSSSSAHSDIRAITDRADEHYAESYLYNSTLPVNRRLRYTGDMQTLNGRPSWKMNGHTWANYSNHLDGIHTWFRSSKNSTITYDANALTNNLSIVNGGESGHVNATVTVKPYQHPDIDQSWQTVDIGGEVYEFIAASWKKVDDSSLVNYMSFTNALAGKLDQDHNADPSAHEDIRNSLVSVQLEADEALRKAGTAASNISNHKNDTSAHADLFAAKANMYTAWTFTGSVPPGEIEIKGDWVFVDGEYISWYTAYWDGDLKVHVHDETGTTQGFDGVREKVAYGNVTPAVKRIAMFVIPLNEIADISSVSTKFHGFILKASDRNFGDDFDVRFYCNTDINHVHDPSLQMDRAKLYWTTSSEWEPRRLLPLLSTYEDSYHPAEIVALVDVSCLERSTDHSWLSDANENLVWVYARIAASGIEKMDSGNHYYYHPIQPVKWFSQLPSWAN